MDKLYTDQNENDPPLFNWGCQLIWNSL